MQVGFEGGNLETIGDGQLICDEGSTGTCELDGPVMGSGGLWRLDDTQIQFDTDPSVLAITSVTNFSASVQTFVVMVTLPIAPAFGPPSLIQGSISGSLTDTSSATGQGVVGDASVSAAPGDSIYSALIDGIIARTLLDDPAGASIIGVPNGSTSTGLSADFGIPLRELFAGATTTDIAITLRFRLSPGDSASFTSVFDVVPEPATGGLVAFGLVALALRRRSR